MDLKKKNNQKMNINELTKEIKIILLICKLLIYLFINNII